MRIWLVAICTFCLITGLAPDSALGFSPDELRGDWRGKGTTASSGESAEQIRCKLKGTTTSTSLSMKGQCATTRGKGNMTLSLKIDGSTFSGSWISAQARGPFQVSGQFVADGLEATLVPTDARDQRGVLSITRKDAKTFVLSGRSKLKDGGRAQIVFTRR